MIFRKFLFLMMLTFCALLALSCANNPTGPKDHFLYLWVSGGGVGTSPSVTVDYERNGKHMDIGTELVSGGVTTVNVTHPNQVTLPLILQYLSVNSGDAISLTVTYTDTANKNAPVLIQFYEDRYYSSTAQSDGTLFASAISNGSASCSSNVP